MEGKTLQKSQSIFECVVFQGKWFGFPLLKLPIVVLPLNMSTLILRHVPWSTEISMCHL